MKATSIIKILSLLLLLLIGFSVKIIYDQKKMKQQVTMFYLLTLQNAVLTNNYNKDSISSLSSKPYVDVCKFIFKRNAISLEVYKNVAPLLDKNSQAKLNEGILTMALLKKKLIKDVDLYPSKLNLPSSTMNDVRSLLSQCLEFDKLLSIEISNKLSILMEEINDITQ